MVALLEPFVDPQASRLLGTDRNLATLELQRPALDPDDGLLAFPDHRVDRDGGRRLGIAGRDLEAREHFGLERAVGIGDFRAYRDASGRDVRRRADGLDAGVED